MCAEESVKNAVDPVAQAATTTANAGTAQVSLTGKVTVDGQDVTLSGTGAVDLAADRGHMQVKTSGAGESEVEMDEVLDGRVYYLRSDAFASDLPDGKHWVKLDLDELARDQGIDLGQLQQLGGGNPTDFLAFIKQTSDVQKVGSESIDGTPTTHYKATIDLEKLARSDDGAAKTVRQIEQLGGPKTLPVDVWIDSRGQVRREQTDITTGGPMAQRAQITVDYEKFGVPVDVDVPDADDTVDFSDIING
jgi:LppX_LprAFG lipoprotein